MAAILASANISRAAITLTIEEIGSDVIASYTGSLDTSNMGFGFISDTDLKRLDPSTPSFTVRLDEGEFGSVAGFGDNVWNQAPESFGTGLSIDTTSFSAEPGNTFSFDPFQVIVASSYSSGDPLSGSLTFEGKTFQTIGITPGTYNAEFGSGDTLTINAIPEPSSYGFLLGAVGLATAIFCRRRRPSAA